MDMKLSVQERKEMISTPLAEQQPKYPYGLRINLCPESLAKLGISSPPEVDSQVKFKAEAKVVSVSACEEEGESGKFRVELQIVEMELEKEKKENGIVDVMYKG